MDHNDISSIQRSITEMRCVQEEQKLLLQELLQQGPKDLKAVEQLVQEVPSQNPVTHIEMQALLGPMQNCLLNIQSKLKELSDAPVVEKDIDTLAAHTGSVDDSVGRQITDESGSEKDNFVPDAEDKLPDEKENVTLDAKQGLQRRASLDDFYTAEGLAKDKSAKSIEIDMIEKRKIQKVMEGDEDVSEQKTMDKIVQMIEKWLQIWSNIEIPVNNGCIHKMVNSKCFQPTVLLAIFLNSVLVAATADWQIQHIGQDQPKVLSLLEVCFTGFFLAELILRLVAYRMYFFFNDDMVWNIFDFILVTISVVDFIFERFVGAQAAGNVSFMRLLRLLKLARVFRSLRTFQFFRALTVMLNSLRQALTSLFWGLILLLFVLYLYSLIYLQALIDYLKYGEEMDADLTQLIQARFGSLLDVIIALYMSVSGGEDWGPFYDVQLKIGPVYGFLYLIFTFFFFFALLNILTAVVVEKAMTAAEPDRSDRILQRRRDLAHARQELIEICRSIDSDKNGRITYEEFAKWSHNSVMMYLMETIGIDVKDVKLFFSTIGAQHGDKELSKGEVTIENFVEGCLHMQGNATALDMQKQLHDTASLVRSFRHFDTAVSRRLSRIEKVLTTCPLFETEI